MLSRALSLATVMLLIGGFAAAPVRAQNLEAGKSPSQIFAGTCTACHKGARGLLKTVAPGSLPGFLRQHYTTSSEMASVLSSYLISNGATDTRYIGNQPKQGTKDAKQEPSGAPTQLDRFGRPIRRAPVQEAARPDGDGRVPQAEPEGRPRPQPARQSRCRQTRRRGTDACRSRRGAWTGWPQAVRQAAPQQARQARRGVAQDRRRRRRWARLQRARQPRMKNQVQPRTKAANLKQNLMRENPKSAKVDSPKGEGAKSDVPLRSDPVPAVTPAPKSPEGEAKPAEPAPAAGGSPSGSPASTSASNAAPEPQGGGPAPAAPPAPVAASPPPAPPVAPAGPPVPPISQ